MDRGTWQATAHRVAESQHNGSHLAHRTAEIQLTHIYLWHNSEEVKPRAGEAPLPHRLVWEPRLILSRSSASPQGNVQACMVGAVSSPHPCSSLWERSGACLETSFAFELSDQKWHVLFCSHPFSLTKPCCHIYLQGMENSLNSYPRFDLKVERICY